MKPEMATRNTTNLKVDKEGCTDFVLHKSQKAYPNGYYKNIIDYTEHKLIRYANSIKDQQQKLVILTMISDYKVGKIAIAWKRGNPVWLKVTKTT